MATAIMQGQPLTGTEEGEELQAAHAANLAALTARVATIKAAKVDAVANTRALRAIALAAGDNHPAQVAFEGGGLRMQIGDVAHAQLAERFKIRREYYDRMAAPENAPLLAANLNWWMQHEPEDRLLRMLKPDAFAPEERAVLASAGCAVRLRGVLGKGYRTIDDADLVAAIVPTLVERGALLQEFSIDERRMHAAFYTQYRDINDVVREHAERNGLTFEQLVAQHGHARVNGRDIAMVNETIAHGVTIRHSEVGFASIGAAFVHKVLKCLNRMVADNSIAIRHVGGKNGGGDEDVRFLSDATQLMENAALLGRVQDTIAKELEPANAGDRAVKLLIGKVERVRRPTDTPLFEFVGNVGLNLGLTSDQTDALKEETTKAIMEEGAETRFAFVQGITAVARQMTDYDRRLEVERVGFQLLHDDAGALLKLGRDAERNARKRVN